MTYVKRELLRMLIHFKIRGSGWIFEKIIDLRVHIDKYNPLSAKSYIQLPDKTKKERSYR